MQAEVMHEYNVKFVNPRVFVQKRDAATSTSELEFGDWRRAVREEERRKSGVGGEREREREASLFSDEGLGQEEMDAVVRGSGRKSRRPRESTTGRKFA